MLYLINEKFHNDYSVNPNKSCTDVVCWENEVTMWNNQHIVCFVGRPELVPFLYPALYGIAIDDLSWCEDLTKKAKILMDLGKVFSAQEYEVIREWEAVLKGLMPASSEDDVIVIPHVVRWRLAISLTQAQALTAGLSSNPGFASAIKHPCVKIDSSSGSSTAPDSCQCGGTKTGSPHSSWCPKYKP